MLLTPELIKVIEQSCKDYSGDATILESAIGALIIGRTYGWRVLRLLHNSNTYAKYERVLGIKFKDACPERTDLSKKSLALRVVDSVGKYWEIAQGVLPGRTNIFE